MSHSRTRSSDLANSSLGDDVPLVTVPFESSSAQGLDIKESTEESSKEEVNNMVGWIVYKMYGIREVKGVVQSFNSETKLYEVLYRDGMSEKVTEDSLIRYLSPCNPEDKKERKRAKPAIINASNAGHVAPARKATKRKRARTTTAKQSKQVSHTSGDVPAVNSNDGARTSTTQQLRLVSQGSSETPPPNSSNTGKSRYKSLRMNAGR